MKIKDTNLQTVSDKYRLPCFKVEEYINDITDIYGDKATIEQFEEYVRSKGHISNMELAEQKEDGLVVEAINEEIVDNFIDLDDIEISFSENVKLPSMSYCQDFWETKQNEIVVPTKEINATKKPPIGTLIGTSIMSAKEGGNTQDRTGKGSRIMNVKRLNKMYENLINTRKIKPSTINSHIRKLLKLKSKEFEFITLENNKGNQEQYYRLDYSDGFVLVDLRIIHYMFTCYGDNMIQAYLIFLWNCREGWSQLTQQQIAEHLGLTKHSDKQARMIIDKLVMDGFIEQKTSYKTMQIVDEFGIPSSINRRYYEYRVVTINEIIEEM